MKTKQLLIRISPEELDNVHKAYQKALSKGQYSTTFTRAEFIRQLITAGLSLKERK